ncbi:MAG: zf-TFIIB domain-containing protein [Phycisphaerae bacterium]|nr:zf-TFIIB domain-containing protein [Phycisphaerae bacterium]
MCPKCNEPLIVVEFQGVEVDHCLDCRGTWFDAGELELLAEMAGAAPGRLEEALLAGEHGATGRRRCPRCNRKMQVLTVGQPPVEVDRCPSGDGIWLDAGELAAIVKSFAEGEDAVVAEFFGDLFRHELTEQTEDN